MKLINRNSRGDAEFEGVSGRARRAAKFERMDGPVENKKMS